MFFPSPRGPGTFTGIFAGGFVEYLGAQRALERQQAKDERLRVMAMAVPWAWDLGGKTGMGFEWGFSWVISWF